MIDEAMAKVCTAIAGLRLPLEDEKATQAVVADALGRSGLAVVREVALRDAHHLGRLGTIDAVVTMLVPSPPPLRSMRQARIGIEIKIKGSTRDIARQMARYARAGDLDALVLATSKPVALPAAICGKPAAVINLGRAWL